MGFFNVGKIVLWASWFRTCPPVKSSWSHLAYDGHWSGCNRTAWKGQYFRTSKSWKMASQCHCRCISVIFLQSDPYSIWSNVKMANFQHGVLNLNSRLWARAKITRDEYCQYCRYHTRRTRKQIITTQCLQKADYRTSTYRHQYSNTANQVASSWLQPINLHVQVL